MRRLFFACILLPVLLLGEVKICLTMIVKNEEKVIERCLNSVKDIVDCISICDVGSTDNTIPLIETFLKRTGKSGKITRDEWQNFSHNRMLSVQAAQKTLTEFGFPLSQTYLLILDADMTVEKMSAFKKNELEADSYFLPEQSSALSCYTFNTRLLRASLPWENKGSMCGSWIYRGPQQAAKLLTLNVKDWSDGNLTAQQRDIDFIEAALKNDPDNTCLTLRLAHLYRSRKNYEAAIHGYRTRIAQKGDPEEIWFSHYLIAKCLEEKGEWNLACQSYFETYQFNPKRSEPLLKIATHYRLNSQNNIAYLFSKPGSLIPWPQDQMLFDTSPLSNYQFDEELAIEAYYTKSNKEGYDAASALVIKKNVPEYIKDQAYKNLLFYVPQLKCLRYLPIQIECPLIRSGYDERYYPMNPSIVKSKDGYQVICRTVNYTQKGAVHFKTIDPDGIFRTRNFLVHYDHEFNLLSQQEIIEYLPRLQFPTHVLGLEDCRMIEWNQNVWFTCTTRDTNPFTTPQIVLCQLGENKGNITIPVQKLIPLKGPDPDRCEKNWLPFVKDNQLHLIYSCSPFILYKFHPETNQCETILSYEHAHDLSRFRGSAAPIPFDEGHLMLVHETVQFPDGTRYYLHRFAYLDTDFTMKRISKPFIFLHLGIEFCCGMILNHAETELIMAFGIEDNQAGLCFVNLDTVRSLLTREANR